MTSKVNGVEQLTGELADGVIEERQRFLQALIHEMPDFAKRHQDGSPKSLDSLILAMSSYIALWINSTFKEHEALKAHMTATVTDGISMLCGFEVETSVEYKEPEQLQ
jgi:hypothetical protein